MLAVLFEEAGEARLILTRRSSSLRSHAGEVSFPGGRLDPGEDAPTAALREAYEEIALDPAQVTMEGWIHPVFTLVSASLIMPLVATVPARPHVVASPAEVERVFDVLPARPGRPRELPRGALELSGAPDSRRQSDGSFPVWFFEVEGEMIWGATARMIHELLRSCSSRPLRRPRRSRRLSAALRRRSARHGSGARSVEWPESGRSDDAEGVKWWIVGVSARRSLLTCRCGP